jgi:hypothetical protein
VPLGIPKVPVMVAEDWSEAQKQAYAIADNKLTLNGGWDDELLSLELGELEVLGSRSHWLRRSRTHSAGGALGGLPDPDEVPSLIITSYVGAPMSRQYRYRLRPGGRRF